MKNEELIERIDDELSLEVHPVTKGILRDCRAEIVRLNAEIKVTDENHGRTTVLAHKALKDLDIANAEIQRLREDRDLEKRIRKDTESQREELTATLNDERKSNATFYAFAERREHELLAELAKAREYVPMTDDELKSPSWKAYTHYDLSFKDPLLGLRAIEAKFIQRANLIVKGI